MLILSWSHCLLSVRVNLEEALWNQALVDVIVLERDSDICVRFKLKINISNRSMRKTLSLISWHLEHSSFL